MPPASSTTPILKSMLRRRHWAKAPETEEADDLRWLGADRDRRRDAEKISSGVIRKPPPTPNRPERKPTAPPMPRKMKMFADISATGR